MSAGWMQSALIFYCDIMTRARLKLTRLSSIFHA
jgi:hypothetical protein